MCRRSHIFSSSDVHDLIKRSPAIVRADRITLFVADMVVRSQKNLDRVRFYGVELCQQAAELGKKFGRDEPVNVEAAIVTTWAILEATRARMEVRSTKPALVLAACFKAFCNPSRTGMPNHQLCLKNPDISEVRIMGGVCQGRDVREETRHALMDWSTSGLLQGPDRPRIHFPGTDRVQLSPQGLAVTWCPVSRRKEINMMGHLIDLLLSVRRSCDRQ